jgi:hypothetical protein
MDAQRRPATVAIRPWLLFTAGWAVLGCAACLTTFAISTIPALTPLGSNIPQWLEDAEGLLVVTMVPVCVLIPVPLLISGRRLLGRRISAGKPWVTAWTVAASAGVFIESLFVWRLILIVVTASNLPTPSWHALAFAIAYLVVGTAMALVLVGAGRSTCR